MDLKVTKAMPHPRTKKPFPKLDPASITAAPSRGSKNTWRASYCEDQVLNHYRSRQFQLLRRRWKSPFAEIDLVLRSPEGFVHLVEVKSLPSDQYLHLRVTEAQRRRLRRCWQWCLERNPKTLLELAVVSQQGVVRIFPDFFG